LLVREIRAKSLNHATDDAVERILIMVPYAVQTKLIMKSCPSKPRDEALIGEVHAQPSSQIRERGDRR
jgi:hypothetical protein